MKWYLGASSYAMLLEQDRRHWLMKTDKDLEVQDTHTGDVFQGRVDNLGSDIILETSKLNTKDIVTHTGTFSSENVSDVFSLAKSVFQYIPMMNGLHFLRVKSINLMVETTYHNFRLVLRNVKVAYIPIAPDKNDPDVFVYKWYYTTSKPILQSMDINGDWTVETEVEFSEGVTNPIYYYPADEVLQPIEATVDANNELKTDVLSSDDMIGMPLLWFTCDEADTGPQLRIENNALDNSDTLFLSLGHNGGVTPYECKLFPATGDPDKSTPDGPISDWKMVCKSSGDSFIGDVSDAVKPITQVLFKRVSDLPDDQTYVQISDIIGSNKVTLNMDLEWTYDSNDESYSIDLEVFATNFYGEEAVLIPAFDVLLDTSVEFDATTTDTGFAGIKMGSSKNHTEQFPRYPHDITNLEGLPAWIRENDARLTPQNMSLYAVHNTPFYDPEDQSTRQIAGLIMDPGVERTYDQEFHPGKYKINRVDIVNGGSGYNFVLPPEVVVHCYQDPTEAGTIVSGLFYDEERTLPITPVSNLMYQTQIQNRFWYDPNIEEYVWCDLMWDHLYDIDESNLGTKNRFWVRFPDGTISRTLFEIDAVDEHGTVTSVNPLYHDEPFDNVKEMIYGYYNADQRKFYTTKSELIEIIPDPTKVYQDLYPNGWVYIYSDVSQRYQQWDRLWAGSAYDETYDPISLTGNGLQTVWLNSVMYTADQILEVRNAQLAGTGTGLMDSGYPWWLYTYTSGTGLILNIDLEYITEEVEPYTSDDVPTEEIGRVYVLSNDSVKYINNASAKHPKPERTAARICDIPISVMQLSNISGLAPTMVVDKQYVRSEAPFTAVDQEYLFNGSRNRWVRPTDLDYAGNPIYNPDDRNSNSNQFVFDKWEYLRNVDLMNHNDYRITENLNAGVPPTKVSVAAITQHGEGYNRGDHGVIVVGGYSFTYEVMTVSASGAALEVEIGSNDDSNARINIANFNLPRGYSSGITSEYGTSPIGESQGRGLKVTLQIADFEEYIPRKGDVFSDLYAFVRDTGGIWIAEYVNGEWKKAITTPIAEASDSDVVMETGTVSYRDSFMKSIIPTFHTFTVSTEEKYGLEVELVALQTASSINVVDEHCTPVWVPSVSNDASPMDDRTWIDINKLYCKGMRVLTAETKNNESAMQAIKADGGARFDSYIIWRWLEPNVASNRQFEYGVIHRSLDNLQSSDTTSLLPANDLETKQYVHTNAQTMIMWNVPHVGPMVWMYDPLSTIHEKYYVNAHTRDLYVVREPYKWEDIEITSSTDGTNKQVNLFDEDGYFKYKVYTNSPAYSGIPAEPDPIYKQPGFTLMPLTVLQPDEADQSFPLRGSWRLVFPSLTNAYRFKNITDGREFTPVKMQILRGSNIADTGDVINDENLPVNYKTLVMSENTQTGKTDLRVYNQESHQWQNV